MDQEKFFRSAPAGRYYCGWSYKVSLIIKYRMWLPNPWDQLIHNVLKACVNGLKSQNSPKILSAIRGKKFLILLKKGVKLMNLNSLIKIIKKIHW